MRRAWIIIIASSVRHPGIAAAAAVVLTLFLALFIPRIQIDTSAEGFMADRDPARTFYERFKGEFGSDNATLVVLEAEDVFRPAVLETIRALTDSLGQIDGVVRVESLATVRRVRVDRDTLETGPFIGAEIPNDAAELQRIRRDAIAHRVIAGNLVAADAKAAAIVVYTDRPAGDTEFNHRFVDSVDALLAGAAGRGATLYAVGPPLLKASYSGFILHDLTWLTPISGAVLVGVLLLMFRTPDAVVVPLTTVGVSIVWSLGAMGLVGIPLNVLTAMIPSILVTIGFTEDVHLIVNYRARLTAGATDRKAALAEAIEESGAAILVTTATTAIGFATLGLSDVLMLRQFGYASALALVANFVATMTLLPPIMLALASKTDPRGQVERRLGEKRLLAALEWIGWFDLRHRVAIVAVAVTVIVAAGASASRIEVDTDFSSYFPADAPVRARAAAVDRVLAGSESFWIVVDTHRPDGVKAPETLARIERLQQHLAARGMVGKSISIADYVATIRREMRGSGEADDALPTSAEESAQYMLLIDARDLASLVNADASATVVVVRHGVRGSARLKALQHEIETYARSAFPADVEVRITGEAILTANAADYMAVNQLTSFTLTFFAIAVIHSALFMSVRIGLLSLIPDLIPIVIVYGLMSLLGVPLNTGTAIVATVAIGIGVDDTVHHLMTYARELDVYSHPSMALFATLRKAGRAIAGSSIALGAGFLVLSGSSFVPMQQFGIFAALTMLLALGTELFVTPALVSSIRVVTVWDLVQLRVDPTRLAASSCFRGLSTWQVRKVVLMGTLRECPAGTRVASRGDGGSDILLVVTGCLASSGSDDRPARARYEPGAVLVQPPLEESGWSADLVAAESSQVLVLDAESLERLRRRFPFTARKLFRNLSPS